MTQMRILFKAPWGVRLWLITGLCTMALLTIAIIPIVNPEAAEIRPPYQLIPAIGMALVFVLCIPFMVTSYELKEGELIIQRVGWANRIPFGDIRSAWHDPSALSWAIKRFGNDGFLAMHGTFRNKKLGKFRAFVTDGKRAVVLDLIDRTIVISPDDPNEFLQSLQNHFAKNILRDRI